MLVYSSIYSFFSFLSDAYLISFLADSLRVSSSSSEATCSAYTSSDSLNLTDFARSFASLSAYLLLAESFLSDSKSRSFLWRIDFFASLIAYNTYVVSASAAWTSFSISFSKSTFESSWFPSSSSCSSYLNPAFLPVDFFTKAAH